MTVELGIIVTLVTAIIGIISFVIGQKKSSKDDGMTLRSIYRRNEDRNSLNKKYDKWT